MLLKCINNIIWSVRAILPQKSCVRVIFGQGQAFCGQDRVVNMDTGTVRRNSCLFVIFTFYVL